MPWGTWYCSVYLMWPLSEAKLFLLLLMFPIFTSFMSSFLPCGSSKRPYRSAFGVASWMAFKHFPVCESLSNHSIVGDSHRRCQLWAPKVRLLGLTSIGLKLIYKVGLGFPTLSCSRHRDLMRLPVFFSLVHSLSWLSGSLSLFTLYFLRNLLTTISFT